MSTGSDTGSEAGGTSRLTLALCYLAAVFEGLDLQAAGVAAPKLAPAMGLNPAQLGWFFSASTFGLLLGAALGGRLSDRLGRKVVLVASVVMFGALSLATAAATDATWLILARFATGVGLGGALPNLLALVSENSRPGRINAALGWLYAGLPSGGAVASLISVFGRLDDWQAVFIVAGLGPLALAPLLWWKLPDSREQAVARAAAGRLLALPVAQTLMAQGRAGRTLLLWAGFFLALLAFYLLLNWLPTLLVDRGLPKPQAGLVQMSFNIMGALASAGVGALMDRQDLRLMTLASFGVAAAGLGLLVVTPPELVACLIAGGVVGMTMSSTQALLYAVTPANYPTAGRGAGVGAAVAVGRLGSAFGPLLASALLVSGRRPAEVFLVLIPIMLVSGLAILLMAQILPRGTATEA